MFVDEAVIQTMLSLQQVDLQILKAKKERAELPQRRQMALVKQRQGELSEKREQVAGLKEKAEAELGKVEAEDAGLAEKQQRAQELIDAAGTDFRSVESHSKEMGSFAKRRETLAARADELGAQLEKIGSVLSQLDAALAKLEAEAEEIRASFAQDDGVLVSQLNDLETERVGLAADMPADIMALYDKTAARTGGVAVGRLVEDTCGVCRTTLEGGRLIELRASAPLGVCPNCKRLLVVE